MKLSLKRIGISRYQKRSGNIVVTVEQRFTDKRWVGSIQKMTHWAKDFSGKDVEMGEEIFTWSSDTKKELYEVLTSYILEN